jgi:rhomboid protease GluP
MGSPPSIPEAEILPPEGVEAPPPVARKQRPSWAVAPATYVLMGINCAVFVAMAAHHVSIWGPDSGQLMSWGANHAGAVLVGGQWQRIITAMFVHVGWIHLATNMWCLWNLGLLAEPLVGSTGLAAAYILTGAAGNLLSTLWNFTHPLHNSGGEVYYPAGAGASGAVFGIAGILIVLLNSNRLPVPKDELKKLRRSVIYFAAINLAIGYSVNFGSNAFGTGLNIDNSAHLGGFVCGLIFALPMVPRFGSPRPQFVFRLRVAVALVTGLLVYFGFFLAQLPG